MIEEAINKSCSLSKRIVMCCCSILLGFGVILLFNDEFFAFVQPEELYQIVFGNRSRGRVRGGAPLSSILFVLDDIRHILSV